MESLGAPLLWPACLQKVPGNPQVLSRTLFYLRSVYYLSSDMGLTGASKVGNVRLLKVREQRGEGNIMRNGRTLVTRTLAELLAQGSRPRRAPDLAEVFYQVLVRLPHLLTGRNVIAPNSSQAVIGNVKELSE